MCLAIPMQVVTIDGRVAHCEARGITRDVSLFLLPENGVDCGDFVMVHVGYAIQKIQPQAARSAWETHEAMAASGDR